MYKIFHGFALVEAYQNLKKAKRLAENKSVSRFVKLAIAIVVSLVLWCLPIEIFGVEGLTVIEQRLISIFIFATFMWVFEAVPAWTTSVLIVFYCYSLFRTAAYGSSCKVFLLRNWEKQ